MSPIVIAAIVAVAVVALALGYKLVVQLLNTRTSLYREAQAQAEKDKPDQGWAIAEKIVDPLGLFHG